MSPPLRESSSEPMARVSDMLLNPGKPYEYNGKTCTYPDIRMVLIASKKLYDPPGACLDDYTIFSRIAAKMGVEATFTEGRNAEAWLRRMYENVSNAARAVGSRPSGSSS